MNNNNQLPLVTYPQAVRLKAAGFDWPTERYYHVDGSYLDDDADKYEHNWNTADKRERGRLLHGDENAETDVCSAPTVALILKWLRDVKGALYEILRETSIRGCVVTYTGRYKSLCEINGKHSFAGTFDTYEAAESALLDSLLKLIENEG